MSKQQKQEQRSTAAAMPETPFFDRPLVGTVFTILSGLAFLFICMILPLVGKAGMTTVHAKLNTIAFAAALVACLVLAALATLSKMQRRRIDNSPPPVFSLVLLGLSGLLLVALVTGLLRI